MIIGRGDHRVELELIELGAYDVPGMVANGDLKLEVRVYTGYFCGIVEAPVLRCDWNEFVEQMSEFARTGQGRATLLGMSPNQLRLTIESLDADGRIGICGEIASATAVAGGQRETILRFDPIEFDDTSLPAITRELRALTRAAGSDDPR